MNLKNILDKYIKQIHMKNLGVDAFGIKLDVELEDKDKKAAWELYVEMITRIATQYLEPDQGDEKTALESIHKLFDEVRRISKSYGPECYKFTKIAVFTLNNVIRPFTAKWHKYLVNGEFDDMSDEFREELKELQEKLRAFTVLLAEMCGIEDITDEKESEAEV